MDGISTDENESRRVRAEKSSNMAKVFTEKPKPLDFVMPGLVVETPGLLIAPGATGKSFWALQAGISIASGSKTFGINAERTGEVVFLSAEDPINIVESRLFEMGSFLSTDERIRAEQNFFLIDYCNKQINIMNDKTCLEIINICNGARLIIIDTMSRVHQLMENDNGQMSKLISQVGNIAKETKAAILICHHTSKKAYYEGHANEQQSARGASSLVDNSRYVGFLSKMTSIQSKKLSLWKEGPHISEDEKHRYVEFGVAKQNYGEPLSSCWYQRQNGGVLLPVILHEIKDGQNKSTNTKIRYGKNLWQTMLVQNIKMRRQTMISTFKSDNILPTSTTYQSRLQLFQPTRRPKAIDRIIDTAWGKIRIKGRIGQAHADIFEAMLSACDKHKILDDGRIRLLIDPYKISQISNQNSWSTFKKNLDDLKQALIEIREPERLKCIGHLIDHIGTARQRNGSVITKSNPFGGVRELWIIELGKVGTTLINYDLRIFYDTQKIANLTHGISQAIARHILTHKTQPNGGWLLDRLILVTGAAARSLRDRRREIRQDALLLVKLGIFISNGHVEYKRGGLEYKRGEANFCGA